MYYVWNIFFGIKRTWKALVARRQIVRVHRSQRAGWKWMHLVASRTVGRSFPIIKCQVRLGERTGREMTRTSRSSTRSKGTIRESSVPYSVFRKIDSSDEVPEYKPSINPPAPLVRRAVLSRYFSPFRSPCTFVAEKLQCAAKKYKEKREHLGHPPRNRQIY